MNSMVQFLQMHKTVDTLIVYYIGSSFVGSLPAPTASSTMFYQFFFKFSNTLAGNLTRAFATRVEKSPNFQDAVVIQQKTNGAPKS
jgi:hypothetical protein